MLTPPSACHLTSLIHLFTRRRRRQRVVIKDRSVTPEWPRVVDLLHRSAGGVLLLSLRSWSIHRLLGRPRRRFQLWSGRWPRVRSTWHRSAWWVGVSSESLAMWLKTYGTIYKCVLIDWRLTPCHSHIYDTETEHVIVFLASSHHVSISLLWLFVAVISTSW